MIRVFYIVAFLYLMVSSAHASQTLNLCVEDADYLPYISLDNKGYLADLVEAAAIQTGIVIQYHHRPWKRCLAMVAQGEFDAMVAVSWTAERAQKLAYPLDSAGNPRLEDRVWMGIYPIFVHRNSAITWDGDSFTGLKTGLGTPLGYISAERLKRLNALAPQSPQSSFGLELVALMRLDGYVVEEQIGWQSASASGIKAELRILDKPFLKLPWYVTFSPRYYGLNKTLVEDFWRAIGKARAQNFPQFESNLDEHEP